MSAFDSVTPDGAILKARRSGRGAPLVLVSGLGGTASFWDPTIAALGDRFEVITFDQRGIAGSTRGAAPTTIDQLARDVLTVCDAAGIHRAAFLGHSTGGCIVQSLAVEAPERVERAVLSATWLEPGRYMSELFAFRRALLDSDPAAYARNAALLSYPPAWLEANWAAYERAAGNAPHDPARRAIVGERIDALLAFDGSATIGDLRAPAMVIGADDDMVVPAFLQRDLAAALPDAVRLSLSEGGHFYPLTRTDAFVAAVEPWLANTAIADR